MGLKAVVLISTINPQQEFTGSGAVTVTAQGGITVYVINQAVATTVNLPATGAANQIVVVQDGSNAAATNNITVQGNGHNINIPQQSAASSYVIGSNGTDAWFNWQANSSTWGVLS